MLRDDWAIAKHRPKVSSSVKIALYEQAGRKCANPGCPNALLESHHIHEWHVYQTHDQAHMIALCASCHDHVDRGDLRISDGDLYRWKGNPHDSPPTAHIFVEPGPASALLLGSTCYEGDSGLLVFALSDSLGLSFAVRGLDIMLLSLRLADLDGTVLVEVVDGYVRSRDARVQVDHRPGRVCVERVAPVRVMPAWAKLCLLNEDPEYRVEVLPILDAHVLEPGLVRVQGIWMEREKGIVITEKRLSLLTRSRMLPVSIVGDGKESRLHFSGAIDGRVFGFE